MTRRPSTLPYGSFRVGAQPPRLGALLDDQIADLASLSRSGRLPDPNGALQEPKLNAFLAEGPARWAEVRAALGRPRRRARPPGRPPRSRPPRPRWSWPGTSPTTSTSTPRSTTPPTSGGSSGPTPSRLAPELAAPAGRLPRPRRHGRRVAARRSCGRAASAKAPPPSRRPMFGPSRRLDIEAELGFVVGVGVRAGLTHRRSREFADHVFGVVRPQRLVAPATSRPGSTCPLGPFLGKSLRHLDRRRGSRRWPRSTRPGATCPAQDPPPLPYLADHRATARGRSTSPSRSCSTARS